MKLQTLSFLSNSPPYLAHTLAVDASSSEKHRPTQKKKQDWGFAVPIPYLRELSVTRLCYIGQHKSRLGPNSVFVSNEFSQKLKFPVIEREKKLPLEAKLLRP